MEESLPFIASALGADHDLQELTAQAVTGKAPWEKLFVQRFNILNSFPAATIRERLSGIALNSELLGFIGEYADQCAVVTGNHIEWIRDAVSQYSCPIHASEGSILDDGSLSLERIVSKSAAVKSYQSAGEFVVFIGDGNNDADAMSQADLAVAVGIVHEPAKSVMEVSDFVVYDSHALVRLLRQIANPSPGSTVVLCCAGSGSRLGLGVTKSLVDIQGVSLISIQLDALTSCTDLRIVVGYQGEQVIREALRYRRDVAFVLNHSYKDTRTGASLYLGSRFGRELTISWDGDLLVHPDDVANCLDIDTPFVGGTLSFSDEPTYMTTNPNNYVVSFSETLGEFEWSGPAGLQSSWLTPSTDHVWKLLERHLPLPFRLIRAMDIDTMNDYRRACEFVASW